MTCRNCNPGKDEKPREFTVVKNGPTQTPCDDPIKAKAQEVIHKIALIDVVIYPMMDQGDLLELVKRGKGNDYRGVVEVGERILEAIEAKKEAQNGG